MTNRRRFLHRFGVLAAVGLAGCSSADDPTPGAGNGGNGGGNGGSQVSPTSTAATQTATTTETPGDADSTPSTTPDQTLGPETAWPMYGFDERNQGRTAAAGPADDPDVRWAETITDGWATGPAVSDDTVFVGTNRGVLFALNILTGFTRWKHSLGTKINSFPAIDETAVYVASEDKLVALDRQTGSRRWTQSGSFGVSSPTLTDGVVYIGTLDGFVVGHAKSNGKRVFRYDNGSPIVSTPAVDYGNVYFGAKDGIFSTVDIESGDLRWSEWTNGAVFGSPTVVGSTVYLGNDQGKIYARNAITGGGGWTAENFTQIKTSPAADDSFLYATDRSGTVAALDLADGTEAWRVDLGESVSTPTIAADALYVAADDIYALDPASGATNWTFERSEDSFRTAPSVTAGTVTAADFNGKIFALEEA